MTAPAPTILQGMPQYAADGVSTQQPQQMPSYQSPPQTGLIGSEQALTGGLSGATQLINQGANQAVGAMGAGTQAATKYLSGLEGNNFSADTSLGADVTNPLNEAAGNFSGYMTGGTNAAKLQADYSGANGPEAKAAAEAIFQQSIPTNYLMQQMQKATERSAAARGGLMSGNVLAELQRNAAGIASQDYQNQFNNLGTVAGQGLSAAGQVAGLRSNQANIAGQLKQTGINANLQATLANQEQKYNVAKGLSDLANQYGINVSNVLGSAAGANAGNVYNTGLQMAQGRTNAGAAIAKNAADAASGISKLLEGQGVNVSNEMASDINNVTKMLAQYGLNDQASNQNLAAMIANITGGQATNTMSAYNTMGAANAAGTMGVNTSVQSGLQNAIATGLLKTPTAVQ